MSDDETNEKVLGAQEETGDGLVITPKVETKEIEVKTLEEDEDVCFKCRAKLYVFVPEDIYGGEVRKNWWRERGTGDVKLLKHREMKKVRVLMRQDKTLKICANHLVSPFVELKANVGSDRSWVFTAADFADEELKTETFAIKFGSTENANLFKEKIEMAKKINAGEMEATEMAPIGDDDDQEKAALDKQIEERNKRDQIRRDSIRAQNAVEDSDHDSQAEDINEGSEARIKATVGDPGNLAAGLEKVSLLGGFQPAEVDDAEVKEAAAFAAQSLGKGELLKIVEAAKQVVAGMNYQLHLHIKHPEPEETHAYVVKVYKPLPSSGESMSLTETTHKGKV